MEDLIRHKTLLVLSARMAQALTQRGLSLPPSRQEALNDPRISEIDIYDPDMPSTAYLDDTLGACLLKINDADFRVLKAYTHGKINNEVRSDIIDNLVFSGGGGKGVAYTGLIDHLSRLQNIAYDPTKLLKFFNAQGIDISQEKLLSSNKATRDDFQDFLMRTGKKHGKTKMEVSEWQFQLAKNNIAGIRNTLDGISAVSGTSAGAITALPVALGMKYEDYRKLVNESKFNHFFARTSGLASRVIRFFKPDFYDNRYLKQFSKVYVKELTKHLEHIIPHTQMLDNNIKRRALINSLLKDQSIDGIEHIFNYAKEKDVLDLVFKDTKRIMGEKLANKENSPLVKAWRSLFVQTSEQKEPVIKHFNNAEEAFFVSMYSRNNIDNISEYFGRLIKEKIDDIGSERVKKVLPAFADDAYKRTPRTALALISLAGKACEEKGIPLNEKNLFESIYLMSTLTKGESAKISTVPRTFNKSHTLAALNNNNQFERVDARDINNALRLIEAYFLDPGTERSVSLVDMFKRRNEPNKDKLFRLISDSKLCGNVYESIFLERCTDMTFRDLHKLKEALPEAGIKDLYITATATRFTGGKIEFSTVYFSHEHDDQMPIKDAVRASMSLPFVFNKSYRNGSILYDGGIRENTPATPFKDRPNTLIAMVEDRDFFKNSESIFEGWKKGLIQKFMYKRNEFRHNFNVSESIRSMFMTSDEVKTLDFDIPNSDVDALNRFNKKLMKNEDGFIKDAYYSYFIHKHDNPNPSDIVCDSLKKGIFSSDRYGESMLELAEREESSFGI